MNVSELVFKPNKRVYLVVYLFSTLPLTIIVLVGIFTAINRKYIDFPGLICIGFLSCVALFTHAIAFSTLFGKSGVLKLTSEYLVVNYPFKTVCYKWGDIDKFFIKEHAITRHLMLLTRDGIEKQVALYEYNNISNPELVEHLNSYKNQCFPIE